MTSRAEARLPLGCAGIGLEGEIPDEVVAALASFAALPFVETVRLRVVRGPVSAPPADVQFDVHNIWRAWADGRHVRVYVRELSAERPVLAADLDAGTVTIAPELRGQFVAPAFARVLLQILASREVVLHGGLLVHASGVARSRAVLFLGTSGTGKSTAAAYARVAARPFCEDRAVLYRDAAGVRALATPFGQREGVPPRDVPLGALCFLRQAKAAAMGPIAKPALHLAANAFPPFYSRELLDRAMDAVAAVAEVPAFRLDVPNSPAFVPLIEPFLGDEIR